MTACQSVPKPPVANKIPHTHQMHGDSRVDNYHWMKNRDSAEVLNHLRAENEYTNAVLEGTQNLQESLYKEIRGRIKEDESTPPYRYGNYFYYTRYEIGQEYPIYCRKKLSLTAPEEILLNVNTLAKNQKYINVIGVKPSPDHKLLAYAVDTVGRNLYQVKIINLQTGQLLPDVIDAKSGNFVWANDNLTIFYVQKNTQTLRYEKVFRQKLGSNNPIEIYFEKNDVFSVYLSKSMTDKYIFLTSASFDSSEVAILEADHPQNSFQVLEPRTEKHLYSVHDGGDGFYFHSNWQAKNFRLLKSNYQNPQKKHWKEVLPHSASVYLQDLIIFKNYMVLEERENGLTRLRVLDRKSLKSEPIQFPDPTYVVSLGANFEYDAQHVRYIYESLVTPDTYFDYDFEAKKSSVIKTLQVPNYDANRYQSERIWAQAQDGTRIPISLIYKRGFQKNQSSPLMITAYGSYGYSYDPNFTVSPLSLVDRGFVYAIAHIRGGSEMGREWYDQGRMFHKKNTFNDFIVCTEALIQQGYANPKRIYAMGGSAGGLLMGAVINGRPDLYHAVVAAVPFVDALTTMLDPTVPLTTPEYEQWGNPNEKSAYDYIRSYSPYDNIHSTKYPHVLAVTGYHDSQVQYWEPMKWVAKLRDHQQADRFILLKTNLDAGHSGASGRFEHIKETALEYAFILKMDQEQN